MKSFSSLFKVLLILLIFPVVAQSQNLTPVDITIDRSGVLLRGKFYVIEGEGIFPTVILLHGFPGGDQDVLGIGKKLSEVDINALTFNYSGTHQSEGEFNFENTQKDIKAVFEFIYQPENIHKYKIDTTHIFLGGYSYGGGMALTYAANHPEIKSVFSIGGNDHGAFFREYNRNPEMREMIDNMFDELKDQPETVRFGPGGTPKETVELGIIESNPTFDLINSASLLASKDILLIGGWDDHNVSIEHILIPLYRAFKNENAEKVMITAVQDSHAFRNKRGELAEIIIEWINTVSD
jgi:pimeloyl-ACP methyl ester carboxylesterase